MRTAVLVVLAVFNLGLSSLAFAFGSRAPHEPDQVENLGSRVINDSLVSNLTCANLDKDKFLLSVQPDAYSIDRQIPVTNWPSSNGLAQCWSLTHAQRLFYYMGRYGMRLTEQDVKTAENTILGANDDSPKIFAMASPGAMIDAMSNFEGDIEHYQDWRFFRPGNIGMVTGNRERSRGANANTFAGIEQDLSQGRLPIVVIRAELKHQHTVLIKRMVDTGNSEVHFVVYDSNHPEEENDFFYDPSEQEFYAPSVLDGMVEDTESPVGLFLVDEDDMDNIQDSLYSFYTNLCKN